MKRQIAALVAKSTRRARGLTVYHELGPDLYSVTSQTFIGRVYSLFGLKNIADAADSTGSGYPKLSAEYVVSQSPDVVVLADIHCCEQSPRTVAARPGGRTSRRSARERSSASTTRSRRGGGRASSTSSARSPRRSRICARYAGRPCRLWILAAAGFLVVALLTGALVGPVHIGLGDALQSIVARLPFVHVTRRCRRPRSRSSGTSALPRVVLGALVGAMLAVAGASYQGVFHNPLADPYLLGVAAGAGLGATIAVVYLPHGLGVLPPAAFVGASLAVATAYAIGRSAGAGSGGATLVLAGVTVASFFTAVQTFVQQQHSDTLQEVYSWILGRLPSSGWRDVAILLPYVVVAITGILLHRRLLDVLSVGDEEAASLGVQVGQVRLVVVLCATVGTAAAVSVSGLIGFVGIIVPHAIRLVAGPSYRLLLPLSVLVGAGFLVLADVIARTALSPAELPIGVVTAFFGAPFFAVVLRTSRRMAS